MCHSIWFSLLLGLRPHHPPPERIAKNVFHCSTSELAKPDTTGSRNDPEPELSAQLRSRFSYRHLGKATVQRTRLLKHRDVIEICCNLSHTKHSYYMVGCPALPINCAWTDTEVGRCVAAVPHRTCPHRLTCVGVCLTPPATVVPKSWPTSCSRACASRSLF